MNIEADRWFLQPFWLLETLTDAQRQTLQRAMTISELKRGSRIYAPGDPGNHLYLLRFGVVKLGAPQPDRGLVILMFLHAGDLFGESSLISDAPRDHVAEVHEDSVICAVPREPLLEMMHQTPEFGFQLAKLMSVRLHESLVRLEQLLQRSAHGRVAHALAALGRQFGAQIDEGLVIPLRLSQSDLANLVGVRRETVSLVLHDLRERGLVEDYHHHLLVHDPDALAGVS